MDRVKGVLISRGLLKGDPLAGSRPLRHLRGDNTASVSTTVILLDFMKLAWPRFSFGFIIILSILIIDRSGGLGQRCLHYVSIL